MSQGSFEMGSGQQHLEKAGFLKRNKLTISVGPQEDTQETVLKERRPVGSFEIRGPY